MILIVGAGPTGLLLAYWLTKVGIPIRLIDKASEPGTTSRALVVHARTLELYQQLGLAAGVAERGLPFNAVNVWISGTLRGHAEFGPIGQGLTPFPEIVIFPQDEHERFLIEQLGALGVNVEREVSLETFTEAGDAIDAQLRRADGTIESVRAAYIVGCDGARSRVREVLGTGFPGGTYERMFYVADVRVRGPITNHQLHVALDDADFLAAFPLKGQGVARLIGTVEPSALARGDSLTWNDVSHRAIDRMKLDVEHVNWFSTYHVHHRVAANFRSGRAFLAGDAAHIHSPVGGQGMNTGLGDAVNLAWKLAAVVQGRADLAVLDSYEPERIAFARRLVSSTDRAFTFSTANGPIARVARRGILPRILPWLLNRVAVRRFMFRTISQTSVEYRASPLSTGHAGSIRGGDRLPWVMPEPTAPGDNYSPLTSLDWQVHVYGNASDAVAARCGERGLPLHQFPWREPMRHVGLRRNTAYLVRPDGYVAIAGATADSLSGYLSAHRITNR